jgi:hypothetical protein
MMSSMSELRGGVGIEVEKKRAKLNFYWISITYTSIVELVMGRASIKAIAQKSQPQKVKHIELLSASECKICERELQNLSCFHSSLCALSRLPCRVFLCKSIICTFDCSMYQINGHTPSTIHTKRRQTRCI